MLDRESPSPLRYVSKKVCTQYAVTASCRRPDIPQLAEDAEHAAHDAALHEGAVVAEHVMERAADRDEEPPVGRYAIIDRPDVADDLNARRVGCGAVVAQEEHERLMESGLDHAAVRSAVDVDACLASRIFVAELRSHRAAEGVSEYSHARHVEPTSEPARRVRRVQPSEAIEDERDVAGPRRHHPARTPFHLVAIRNHTDLRVVLLRSSHHPAVGEDDAARAIRRIEAHHDVPVTRQILGECRVVQHSRRSARSDDHHGIRSLLRRHVGVTSTVPVHVRCVSRQKRPDVRVVGGVGLRAQSSRKVVIDDG